MPTILIYKGWRVFFFANEGNEPIHVHCKKGSAIAKFWIYPYEYDIKKEYVRRMTKTQEREIRKILFTHLDDIVKAWNSFKEKKNE